MSLKNNDEEKVDQIGRRSFDQIQMVSSMNNLTVQDDTAANQTLNRVKYLADVSRSKQHSSADDLHRTEHMEQCGRILSWRKEQPDDQIQRRRNLTERCSSYRFSILDDRRKTQTKGLFTHSAEINGLLNSYKNCSAVRSEMKLFDEKFQFLTETHNEMQEIQKNTEEATWFAELDNKIFTFKNKVNSWLMDAEEKRSQRSRSSRSSSTRSSSKSNKSKISTKEKAMQEKLRVAVLLAESAFLEKKRSAQQLADE